MKVLQLKLRIITKNSAKLHVITKNKAKAYKNNHVSIIIRLCKK